MSSLVRIHGYKGSIIHGKYHDSKYENSPVAIIIPSQGPDNDLMNFTNGILFNIFINNGFSVLRFTYSRTSNTDYLDNNNRNSDELVDVNYALQWLSHLHSDAVQLWAAGSGFGGYLAMQMLMRRTNASGFVALSLPVDRYDFGFLSPCPAPGLLIHGVEDTVTPISSVRDFTRGMQQQSALDIQLSEIPQRTHDLLIKGDEYQDTNQMVIDAVDSYIGRYFSAPHHSTIRSRL